MQGDSGKVSFLIRLGRGQQEGQGGGSNGWPGWAGGGSTCRDREMAEPGSRALQEAILFPTWVAWRPHTPSTQSMTAPWLVGFAVLETGTHAAQTGLELTE